MFWGVRTQKLGFGAVISGFVTHKAYLEPESKLKKNNQNAKLKCHEATLENYPLLESAELIVVLRRPYLS